jgi:hypothetical protein
MHLIVGHAQDACCADVLAQFRARGLRARLVDSPLEPPARLVWSLDRGDLTIRLVLDDGRAEEIDSVLVRSTGWLDPAGWEPADHAYMQAEMHAALLAVLAGLPCPVINRTSAALWYRPFNSLLAWRGLLRRCGLRAPEAVLTDSHDEARAFGHRLDSAGVPGVVYTPLTSCGAWSIGPTDWDGLATLQARLPVCLTEPHGRVRVACIVGRAVIWEGRPDAAESALESRLLDLAAEAGLDFVEIATAPVRDGAAVVLVEPLPRLEHFGAPARAQILGALIDLLTAKRDDESILQEALS